MKKLTSIDASPAGAGPRFSGKVGTASISVRLQGRANASSATKPYAEDAKSRHTKARETLSTGGARYVLWMSRNAKVAGSHYQKEGTT